ncbi:ABC transporter ATP-binding protein [Thiopseudomonas alkaliphila]|uniref:ABC transporter ATP-binding protein n=1 Tax=Thiopseudomonas alkaliphila TaxID=1697053 RepID=UPI00069DBA38|nr:ABC transporter ATP-binding protein [Thiopseudomonas alkaliphila]AKX50265.1 ABC transporter ATP-binding protein [Thiopseudomonas alkaliphila]AKX56603.1 ABC transporter ATP-binding protein [Thiopseudomonas alkaliphila]
MPNFAQDKLQWRYIKDLAWKQKKFLVLANLLAIFAALCAVPIPLLLPLLVDEVLLDQPAQAVNLMQSVLPSAWQQPIGYIACILLTTLLLRLAALLFNAGQARLFAQLAQNIIFAIRQRLLQRLQRISMAEYETLGSGTVTTHLVTDMNTLDQFIGETLSRLLVSVLTLAGTASILFWMHWQLALLILVFNPFVVFLTIKLGKKVRHLKRLENDSTAIFTQALSESLDAIHELRASNRQAYFFQGLTDKARTIRDRTTASQWRTNLASRLSGLLFQFGIDIFRAAAMLTVLFSDLSIGQMLAVFSYLWFIIGPVEQLLNLQYAYYAADGALARVNQLLAKTDEPQTPTLPLSIINWQQPLIRFEQVSFQYANQPLLNNLSFSINPGETVALVGASGGGKSTIAQLLLGLYQPDSGRITLNQQPIAALGYSAIRQHIAMVMQQPALFNSSVRDNLLLGRQATDSDCWQALRIAQLADTVEQMPEQLDTLIGRSGVKLSGGQKQRLAIARMVMSNPEMIILDEATSAVDTLTEQALHQQLNQFLQGKTTLIIAHRLSAVLQADRVLVLADGQIVQQGTHQQLLQEPGLYQQLYGSLQL